MGLLRRLVLLLAALRAAALTVLITGGNGGIGTELAVEFAKAGHSVISACRGRSAHVHERLVEEQLEARVRIILGLDVLDDAKTDAFFDALQGGRRARRARDALGAVSRSRPRRRNEPRQHREQRRRRRALRGEKSALNAAGVPMGVDAGRCIAGAPSGHVATPMTGDRGDLTAAARRGLRSIVDDLDLAKSAPSTPTGRSG
ncbi:hypothetical protein JL722_13729 [Aureococcus anophagefferens]|nr:hypothetical protein JL722_13729 [Aureococcus anophagefferens]